ncbi:acyl-CoA thioester hydrolase [Aquiflexum balticum DSM 16537]|uniref:Acyl-CoA thioester hydrolase n=1 Tax=Aquiflexum balticum DSM 16537 TaxID=758820 RepID=A0A1W2GZF2_9BACT|nr:thioesterase family protein [Aquiflexum balticum]SMD41606.1 acyl-CoA thioester hydrolase [Aquiflexum balticum DSM 16537]
MKKFSIEDVLSSFHFSVPVQVRFSDIDSYMHVNNGIFFNYLEHARASYLFQFCGWDILKIGTVVANIQIDYRLPVHLMDKPAVYVRCIKIGNTSFVLEQVVMGETEKGEMRVFAESTTTMVSVNMETMSPVPVPAEYAAKMMR